MLRYAVMSVAHNLIDGCDDNPEYVRAVTEMACDLLGISTDDSDAVTREIRAHGRG